MVKTVLQVQGVSNTAIDNATLSCRKIQASDQNIQYVINNIVNNKTINYKRVARENKIIKGSLYWSKMDYCTAM